ncbi:Non-specific serine/threonine protein kinase [Heracleum sosnowskyi]|uniref:non-specific serine/threonine protein kinase n=1 Tax=Heracleum sosnowskyi TaxID=360622 RepID=A0AAD8JIL5_9APIA|nr:Non-specific serine/threonine protein kinase [Heracleum sosnowskyi]
MTCSNNIFLLVSLFIFLCPSVSAANNELQQLLSFKSSLPDSTQLPNWSKTNNLCDFTGVTCNANSTVVSLDLSSNKLHLDFQKVSYFLLTLPNLQTLFLKNSNITGKISPLARFQCSSVLTKLDLSENSIAGPVSDIFSLSSCIKLQSLNLSGNLLEYPASNSKGLNFNLESLDLSYNKITGPNFMHWLLSRGCSELVYLSIKGNKIAGSLVHLQDCKNLEFLDLSSNSFVGELSESFAKLTNLETLDVSSNLLNGSVPVGICQDPKNSLKVLYLQNNEFTGPIPDSLGNCSKLESLDLSFNYLDGTIPSSLGSLSNLRDLILWLNQLHGLIPEELMYIKTLKNLILDFNVLSGSIPSSLGNCTSLKWISLSNNQLSGEIPASFGQLPNLAILKLGNNSLTGSIPSELGNCRSLIWIDLNTNLLNGTIPPALFKQSGNIAAELLTEKPYGYVKNDGSKECHGAGNLLEFGGIRQEQFNRISTRGLNYLGDMDLSNNHLSGSIPESAPFNTFPEYRFLNNTGLCGYPLPQCGSDATTKTGGQNKKSSRRQLTLAGSVAMGLLFSLFCIIGLILIAVETRKRMKKKEAVLEGAGEALSIKYQPSHV